MKRLVVADVNETILPPGIEVPSPAAIAAVNAMHERGIALAPVTSLSIPFMQTLARELRLKDIGILDGGATVYNFSTVQRDPALSRWLDPEVAGRIVGSIGRRCLEIYYDEHSTRRTPETADPSEITAPTPSIFAVFDNQHLPAVMRTLADNVDISADLNRYEGSPERSCVQIVCRGVSKASGVRILLASEYYRDLQGSDMLVIADGDPDIALFEAMPPGALKVAMANGSEALKARADLIAPHVADDGFATIMHQQVLR